jgi:hypothetical protein
LINDGSGNPFSSRQFIGGELNSRRVNFSSGLNTLVGGFGSDTFVVSNGGTTINTLNGIVSTGAYDQIIKYGLESSAGENNLVISAVKYLTLSDTDVSQGKFINQAWAAYSEQYIAGNRLDNTLVGYGLDHTLLGAGGRDSISSNSSGAVLIGGTAYGLDNIAAAKKDLDPKPTGNDFKTSIYRDYDPVPVTPNGPGSADNSQYWMVNGPFGPVFDPLRNSDTLVSGVNSDDALRNIVGATIDGGAGYDSMVGGTGNDTLYVSSINTLDTLTGTGSSNNRFMSHTGAGYGGDVVVGGGGNDWIILTGSDVYWSGRAGATTATLGYALSDSGDAAGGLSISNIKLQDGSPVARNATGNSTSTGNQQFSRLGNETGSNWIIGNNEGNILNGGGVGGTDGTGIGVDTLTGGTGADVFVIGKNFTDPNSNYTNSNSNKWIINAGAWDKTASTYTDADYVIIQQFDKTNDKIDLLGNASNYWIGSTPSILNGFNENNVGPKGIAPTVNRFGIYTKSDPITKGPNLVAVIEALAGSGLVASDLATPVVVPVGWADGQQQFYNLAGSSLDTNRIII